MSQKETILREIIRRKTVHEQVISDPKIQTADAINTHIGHWNALNNLRKWIEENV